MKLEIEIEDSKFEEWKEELKRLWKGEIEIKNDVFYKEFLIAFLPYALNDDVKYFVEDAILSDLFKQTLMKKYKEKGYLKELEEE